MEIMGLNLTTILVAVLVAAAVLAIVAELFPGSARRRSIVRGVAMAAGLIGIAQALRILLAISEAL